MRRASRDAVWCTIVRRPVQALSALGASADAVELVQLDGAAPRILDMSVAGDGWRELTDEAKAGARYRYRMNHELDVSDPASGHIPQDVHGASEVIDSCRFDRTDEAWGHPWSQAAIYQLHVAPPGR